MWTRRSTKGDLKFTLDGYKLKGSWVLVRTSGATPVRAARAATAAVVAPDQASRRVVRATLDIAEFAPRSVKSDGDFDDILAADNPDVWQSNRPGEGRRRRERCSRGSSSGLPAMKAGAHDAEEGRAQPAARRRAAAGARR